VSRIVLIGILLGLGLAAVLIHRRSNDVVPTRFVPGDRVQVVEEGFWANGATGTVAPPPVAIVSLADGWHGHVRTVQTTDGPRPFYWVALDEARRDADGDGPYHEAEIAERSLRSLGTRTSP
jgi:hypothetical protein